MPQFPLLVARVCSLGFTGKLVGPASAILLLAACGTVPEYKYVTTVSGGQRIEFPIGKGGPERANAAGLTVVSAQFLGLPRGGMTFFGCVIKNESGQDFKKVLVEDVTDETPEKVLEDPAPKILDGLWRGLSEPIKSASGPFAWLSYLDASNRVYRCTVTLADDRTITLNQLAIFPAWLKEGMRRGFKAAEEAKEPKPES